MPRARQKLPRRQGRSEDERQLNIHGEDGGRGGEGEGKVSAKSPARQRVGLSRIARRRHLPSITTPAAQLSRSGDTPRCPSPSAAPVHSHTYSVAVEVPSLHLVCRCPLP